MKPHIPSLILLTLSLSPSIHPAPDAAPIDLERAEEAALSANPAARTARLRYESLLERPEQERALPDPMVAYSLMFTDIETANGPSMALLELSQEIPFRGKRGLRAGVSQAEAHVALETWETVRLDVLYEVRSAYWEIFRIDAALEVLAREIDVLERLEATARAQYAAGGGRQGDVLKAQAERSMLEERRILLRGEREGAAARFNAALLLPAADPVGPALEPPRAGSLPPDEALYAAAAQARPELAESRRMIEAGRLRERLARREFLPDFRVGFQWNRIGGTDNPFAPDPGQDGYMTTVGVSVPLWRAPLRAGLREAEIMTRAAESELEERGARVGSEVRAALGSLRARRELVALYDSTLIPQAEAARRAAEAAYRSGEGDFLDVLDGERTVVGYELARAEALAGLGEALATLERVVGRDLDHIAAEAAGGER